MDEPSILIGPCFWLLFRQPVRATRRVAPTGSWHFDDYYTIVRNDALRSPSGLVRGIYDPALFSADPERPMYRPALVISFVLNYLVLGESVRGFLLINLLLHILNALLVWAVARKLLGEGGELGALA